jgi:hypothetical protein
MRQSTTTPKLAIVRKLADWVINPKRKVPQHWVTYACPSQYYLKDVENT